MTKMKLTWFFNYDLDWKSVGRLVCVRVHGSLTTDEVLEQDVFTRLTM